MKRFQFSLRTLMLLVTICAFATGAVVIFSPVIKREPDRGDCRGLSGFEKHMQQELHGQEYTQEFEAAKKLTLLSHGTLAMPGGNNSLPKSFYGEGLDNFGLPVVVQVDAIGANITDADLRLLDSLKHVERLKVGGPNITDAGLEPVKSLRHLLHLHLCNLTLTDRTFEFINAVRDLESLTLEDCVWSDKTGNEIYQAKTNPNLKIVEINSPK